MPPHSFDALFRALKKGELAPAYYFHGPEELLKDEAVRAVLDRALDPAARDFNLDQRSAGALDAEAIATLCGTLPMLAERRVVVLRDAEALRRKGRARAALLQYLERPAPETLLVLVQGAAEEDEDKELARLALAVRFDPLPPDRAARWVLHRAGAAGVELEPAAADHLVRSVGTELGALAAELEKLAALPPGPPVTAEQVGELVGVRRGETAFDWRDAALGDDPARAAGLLPVVLSQPGASAVRLVTLLGTSLVGVGATRAHYDRGVRGRALADLAYKLLLAARPFGLLGYRDEAARWSRWAERWPLPRVGAALRAALDADRALKGTTISDDRGIVTDLVLRLAVVEEKAA